MESPRAKAEASIARNVMPLARWWRAEADRTLSELGLSHASGWVLLQVGRLGDAVRQSDLAAAVDMRGASLVRLIDLLEGDELIARKVEERDRRINRIHLTDTGRVLVGRIETALQAVRQTALEGIDDEALEITAGVLDQLAARFAERRRQAR
jgi:MarR family transcriptional regulator for hemolysin